MTVTGSSEDETPGELNAPITNTSAADAVLSADGSRLYVAGTDGTVQVFDVETRALLGSWDVGNALGGIDISPDGTYLLVVERQPLAQTTGEAWWDNTTTVTTYKIDIATGLVTSFPRL